MKAFENEKVTNNLVKVQLNLNDFIQGRNHHPFLFLKTLILSLQNFSYKFYRKYIHNVLLLFRWAVIERIHIECIHVAENVGAGKYCSKERVTRYRVDTSAGKFIDKG